MKLYRFLTRSYFGGRIVNAGETVEVPDDTVPSAHMVDVEAEEKGTEPVAGSAPLPVPTFVLPPGQAPGYEPLRGEDLVRGTDETDAQWKERNELRATNSPQVNIYRWRGESEDAWAERQKAHALLRKPGESEEDREKRTGSMAPTPAHVALERQQAEEHTLTQGPNAGPVIEPPIPPSGPRPGDPVPE